MDSSSYNIPMVGYHHHHHHRLDLFGGTKSWDKTEWTAQDDRLRGGSSISHLTITPIPGSFSHSGGSPGTIATFHGNLDSKTLGGAGFASQRTVGDDKRWDLSEYDGIEVVVLIPVKPESKLVYLDDDGEKPIPDPAPIEEKIYTIILKDCVIRGEPDAGKEISWEWNFKPKIESSKVDQAGHKKKGPTQQHFRANWDDFKPFYRGKPMDEEKKLDYGTIKRFSIMIRSFFQDQKDGEFSVSLISVSAIGGKKHRQEKVVAGKDEAGNVCPAPIFEKLNSRYFDAYDPEVDGQEMVNEKKIGGSNAHHIQDNDGGWFGWLCGLRELF